jgi:hypothetical protein
MTVQPASRVRSLRLLLPLVGVSGLMACQDIDSTTDSAPESTSPQQSELVVAPGPGLSVPTPQVGQGGPTPARTVPPNGSMANSPLVQGTPAQMTDVNVDFARPLNVPLSEDLMARQRELVPQEFHDHPEMGLRAAEDPAGTVELLHMRTARTRYLSTLNDEIHAYTAQLDIFARDGAHMVNAHPRLTRDGLAVRMDGPWISGVITPGVRGGVVLDDPLGNGLDIVVLQDVELSAVSPAGFTVLPLPLGQPAIDGTFVRYEDGGLTTVIDTVFDSIGYGFEMQQDWVASLPEGTTEVRLTQRLPLGEGWVVREEASANSEGGPIQGLLQTCAPLFIDVPGAAPIAIQPPKAWDAGEVFTTSQGRAPWGHGCGSAVAHVANVTADALELTLVVNADWLRSSDRSFPVHVDPYWTFRKDMNTGTAPSPNVTSWTANGWLDDWNNFNLPFSEVAGQTWTGRYGGVYYALGRHHFSVEGLAAAAASAPGGGNVEYFPTFIGTNYAFGGWGWFPYNPGGGCALPASTFRWNVVEHVSYQDFRCTSGSNTNCGWSTLINGVFGTGRYRGSWTTRWTSGNPFAGWDSPVRCNNCGNTTFAEAATCTEAGGTMGTACRVFIPGANQTITLTGNLTAGDVDHWGLRIPAGRSAQFTFSVSGPGGTCNFDPVLELWYVNSGSGTTERFDSIDDNYDPVTGVSNPCPTWSPYGFFPSGSYSIAVRGFSNLDVGPYTLTVTFTDNPTGTTGFAAYDIAGMGKTINPTYDWLGPNGTDNLYWSETLMPDMGGIERDSGFCAAFYTMQIGSSVYRPNPDFVPYIEIIYVGRITNSPTNLAARPLSLAECNTLGQGVGCGLYWTWDAAAKAVWYNLINGVGRIDEIYSLFHAEGGLAENTRYTRAIEGANDFAPGPASGTVTRATAVRVPAAGDVNISQLDVATFTTGVVAAPGMPGGAYSCPNAAANCTAVRYQVRRCAPLQAACAVPSDCGSIAGAAGTCFSGQCVADSGWTRSTTVTWATAAHSCYEVRATYQNQDGVQAEGWSPWVQRTMTTLTPPTMTAPVCADMAGNGVTLRWVDQSTGEIGFRLYPNAASTTPFITEASTTGAATGAPYFRTQPAVSASGNVQVTAVARAYSTSAGFDVLSDASAPVTLNTLHRAPATNELQFDRVTANAIDLTIVSAETRPCDGLTGARVTRCLANGTGCVNLTNPPTNPAAACSARGYGAQWEFAGGRIPGIGDGQIFDTGLAPNTAYEYRMTYFNASGCASATTAFQVTTLPGGPCCYNPLNPTSIVNGACVGECSGGTITCAGNNAATCYCAPPATYSPIETCDNRDNNCDGVIDTIYRADTNTLGLCSGNRDICLLGSWNDAPGNYVPVAELCNGRDDDCDGANDENASGAPLSQTCYSGPAGTQGVGLCRAGNQECTGGSFGACTGQVTPGLEFCNTVDDDCDGSTDEELASPFCLAGRDECSGPTLTGPAGECIDGCRIGNAVCESGVLYCDIDAWGPVVDVQTTITGVEQGPTVDLTACDNSYADVSCGATSAITIDVQNEGQIVVDETVSASIYLDYGLATEQLLAGPFELGRDIALDSLETFTFCWFNTVAVSISEGRTLSVVVFNPEDPLTCIDEGHIGDEQPASLIAPADEVCDGVDNDCNGVNDVAQSSEACTNSAGDSTLSCRNTEFSGWECIAE